MANNNYFRFNNQPYQLRAEMIGEPAINSNELFGSRLYPGTDFQLLEEGPLRTPRTNALRRVPFTQPNTVYPSMGSTNVNTPYGYSRVDLSKLVDALGDTIPENKPSGKILYGSVSSTPKEEEVKKALDILYSGSNQINKSLVGRAWKQYAPGIGDVYDINQGWARLRNPKNGLDPWLGAGQLGLGVVGLGSLAAAPFTGGASVAGNQLAKAYIKSLAKQQMKNLGKSAGLQAFKKSPKAAIKKYVREAANDARVKAGMLSNLIHGNWRYGGSGLLSLYDLLNGSGGIGKLKDNIFGPSDQDYIEQGDNTNTGTNNNEAPTGELSFDPIDMSQYVNMDPIVPSTLDAVTQPSGSTEQFINNLVATNGLNAGRSSVPQSLPQYDSNGNPINKSAFKEYMAKEGMNWTPEQVNAMSNGLNLGDTNAKNNIDLYNQTALPGEEIKVPTTPEEVEQARQMLTGQVDNQDELAIKDEQEKAQYLNELMQYYAKQRDNYIDYKDALKDLIDNYGDRWRLQFNLWRGGNYPNAPEGLNEAFAKQADLYKLIGDVNTKYDKTLLTALGNYNMARAMNMPLGSDFADETYTKGWIDNQANQDKAKIDLLKALLSSNDKALDRANKFDIAKMTVSAINDRSRLSRQMDLLKLKLREAEMKGNWALKAQIANAMNKVRLQLGATNVLSNAGTYGITNPEAIMQAMAILGYDNMNFSANTDDDFKSDFERELDAENGR